MSMEKRAGHPFSLEFACKFAYWVLYSIGIGLYNTFVPYSWKTKKCLKGKKVLITGGASGIGLACAKRLSEEGCEVAIWDVNPENLASSAEDLKKTGCNAYIQLVDISEESGIISACDELKKNFGDIDIVFNNAGRGNSTPFLHNPSSAFKNIFEINLFSNFHIVKEFLPKMIEKGEGHIVATSSFGGICALGEFVDYSSSKFAVRGFMEALNNQLELQGISGIEFTTIFPGYIRTPIWKGQEAAKPLIPMIEVEELAEEIVRGIRLNQKEVYYPRRLTWIMVAKAILPLNVQRSLLLNKFCWS